MASPLAAVRLARVMLLGLFAFGASACSDSSGGGNKAGTGGQSGTATSDLRCGNFLTASEVTALGFDATAYDEDATQTNAGLGVLCRMGKALASIFHGDAFSDMVAGYDDSIMKQILVTTDGAGVGKESRWAALGPELEVIFLATSGKYAASVTARQKSMAENVARALDAKF